MYRDDSGHLTDEGVQFFKDIYEDFLNYDPNNEDEKVVLKANYFSCYRNKLVNERSKKMKFYQIFELLFSLLLVPIIAVLIFIPMEIFFTVEESLYYADQTVYITEEAIVTNIGYDEDRDTVYMQLDIKSSELEGVYSAPSFKITGKSADIMIQNGALDKIKAGSIITFTSAPRYFGDGYVYPIVAVTFEGEELLPFEEGHKALMDSYSLFPSS